MYRFHVNNNLLTGFGKPECGSGEGRKALLHAAFLLPGILLMGGRGGGRKAACAPTGLSNPLRAAHPHLESEGAVIKPFYRSIKMPRASKGASASAASFPKLAPVVHIKQLDPVHDESAQDCVAMLRSLLKQAERGELIGLILIRLTKDNGYGFNHAGMLEQNKTFALGTAEVLKARLLEGVMAQ
ncbi:MAG: hypothetical protein ABS69_00930 [Nitrosomonadales bacterium SCN 54-20]|nr:MAG: hypothetical protein ABS69_00930 [Nitrosomonadales bacterium SCN 54-20]